MLGLADHGVPQTLAAAAEGAHPAPPLQIGFIDPTLPGPTPQRNGQALSFCAVPRSREASRTQGRRRAVLARGPRSPEEFDVIWCHLAEKAVTLKMDDDAIADLGAYVDGGGAFFLTGSAGQLINKMGIDSTQIRTWECKDLSTADLGIVVQDKQRNHPIFAGLDATKPILLSADGVMTYAFFNGVPHGDILAIGITDRFHVVEYHFVMRTLRRRPLGRLRSQRRHRLNLRSWRATCCAIRPGTTRIMSV